MNGLNEAMYTMFLGACNAAIADSNRAKEERRTLQKVLQPVISPTTKKLIEQLMFTIRMITSSEYMNDFRACVTETTVKDFKYVSVKLKIRFLQLRLIEENEIKLQGTYKLFFQVMSEKNNLKQKNSLRRLF